MLRSIHLALWSLAAVFAVARATGHAQSPVALLQQSADAMGGGLGLLGIVHWRAADNQAVRYHSSAFRRRLHLDRADENVSQ